ncbi:cysteine dioxygenase family protein [Micromonospora sp. NPDC049559]|uniref:cysteine dioxygenase n=1 Tax=Micromonospora sp. NPDC049559 TaxID=3155923 RepID=UPI003432B602
MVSLSRRRTDLLAVARRYAADPASWPEPVRFDPVERWYRRLAGGDEHEVWLLTWLPGQGTDLHDHGGSSGAFVVVAGALTEEIPVGAELRPATLAVGQGRRFGPRYVHRVTNRGDQPAVSVHAYSPALLRMTRYDFDGGRLRVAEVAEAGVAW